MTDCIEWTRSKNGGYGSQWYRGKVHRAHRVAYCEAHGLDIYALGGLVVRHKCDNPNCVNPDHLELGTKKDNARDREERGRHHDCRGTLNGRAVLTEELVLQLRAEYRPGVRGKGAAKLAKKYGISPAQAWRVVSGESWSHVIAPSK